MAIVKTDSKHYTNIANAIREKNGTSETYKPEEMSAAIEALGSGGGSTAPVLQEKAATPTEGTQTVTPDAGFDGLSAVTVNPIPTDYVKPSGTLPITTNGTVDVKRYEKVTVNVPTSGGGSTAPVLQEKTVTPTEGAQTVTPDAGFDGLSKVTVNAIPADYIKPSGTLPITTNGTVNVKNYANVTVNVPTSGGSDIAVQQEKIAPITSDANGYADPSTIYPDDGYDAMESVVVYFPEPIDASKIKKGETVLGVTGTYEASGGSSIETCSLMIYGAGAMYQQMIPYIDNNGKLVFLTDCDSIGSGACPYYDSSTNTATFTIPKGAVIMKCGGELSSIAYGSENIENITSNMNIDWATNGQLQFYKITGDVEITW